MAAVANAKQPQRQGQRVICTIMNFDPRVGLSGLVQCMHVGACSAVLVQCMHVKIAPEETRPLSVDMYSINSGAYRVGAFSFHSAIIRMPGNQQQSRHLITSLLNSLSGQPFLFSNHWPARLLAPGLSSSMVSVPELSSFSNLRHNSSCRI